MKDETKWTFYSSRKCLVITEKKASNKSSLKKVVFDALQRYTEALRLDT